jgi:hypothetical protein
MKLWRNYSGQQWELNLASHWRPASPGVNHPPIMPRGYVWPWHKLFRLNLVPIGADYAHGRYGWRLWIYTRIGAVYLTIYDKKRPA